ncbi:hypothetical protein CTAYLR_008098 [Chrysophaeum taylorii]|uniref:histidine--tRNA ligase n=1 Tax=Chrysophaeum taylorii TaxID=2483200 RepID=A0AAD7XHQ3_9STRA|nr:hypothetical protein CTAYLR_008098 [Chrysophaeum taylorii]
MEKKIFSEEDVALWKALTVEAPKSEPTAEERQKLKGLKEREKKGKAEILERLGGGSKTRKAIEAAIAAANKEDPTFLLEPPSGTRDFEPADMRVRSWLFKKMKDAAVAFSFKEYDAPVLESVALFERKAGEEITQQMYNFTDKDGERVALRPEMTPTLARLVLKNTNLATGEVRVPLPLKWFSIPQCWRFETTQRGRKREHYQWNMDIVGEKSVTAEVELLGAMCYFFRSLGLTEEDVRIRVNDRKLLDKTMKDAGVPEELFSRVCVVVDKLDKIGADGVAEMLSELGISPEPILQTLAACREDDSSLGEDVELLFDLAEAYGFREFLVFDPSVVRGLAYYTGIVFEAFDRKGELRAIAGGGRYDKLLELYGGAKCRQIPCVGFGFGDCVILELLDDKRLVPELKPEVDFVVCPFSRKEQTAVAMVASKLRESGFSVDVALSPRKARAAFDLANRAGARMVAFVAPDEWSRGLVRVKDMLHKDSTTGEAKQRDVPFSDLPNLRSYFQEGGNTTTTTTNAPAQSSKPPPPAAAAADGPNEWTLVPTDKFCVIAKPPL